ncbi:hypothetical protein [Methylobacterium aquaticum]|uniref:hypothetical protein n=1 Tax=Methylobacterium aquaticum TaxID=270351 RepID=UPI001AF0FF62|nr:hypothetical protein [Methylobacterium aquaticum]QRE74374.1 hypothetical protein F1D61_12850 [Methylobacterium aquaticum]
MRCFDPPRGLGRRSFEALQAGFKPSCTALHAKPRRQGVEACQLALGSLRLARQAAQIAAEPVAG